MSSLRKLRIALFLCSAGMIFTFSIAAQVIAPQGGEYPLLETIATHGDQSLSQLSLNAGGGYVVWQDNSIDGQGLGIGARYLDSTGSPGVFGSFRINQQAAGDQQRPQLALYPDGSAAFVWEGGNSNSVAHNIFLRFLAPNRVFSTPTELRVNIYTNGNQSTPVIAALPNHNALIAWSSLRQDGSMQGVYARLANTNGQFLTAPFQVNQYTNYNQRNPAIAVATNGSSLIVWISERQFNASSADVIGRLFDPTGQPLSDEFRINSINALCANPAAACDAFGGYTVVWSQKTGTTNVPAATIDTTNGWDIVAQNISANGTTNSLPFIVNTYRSGDQFDPKISTLGRNQLIVWTSLGEDGSREGIVARNLFDGAPVGDAFLVNTTTVSSQLKPAVASDGSSQFIVSWSSFKGVNSGFDLFARRYSAGAPLPTPAAPFVSALWSDRISVSWPTLAGYALDHYEVYMNGAAPPSPPTATVANANIWIAEGLPEHSTNSFRLAYVFPGNVRSPLSPPATAVTYKQDRTGRDGFPDGLPDDWQQQYWGVKASEWPAGNIDSDGDGVSNAKEFQAGTDPTDPNSVLKFWFTWSRFGRLFHWNTQPGFVYQVRVSTNLTDWDDFGSPRFAAGTNDSVIISGDQLAEYYRVIRVH